jgi:hypothetical protein
MNIKERTVITYETEDGQVFESLADARAYALQAQGCNLIEEGIKVGEFNVMALREPDDYVAFMAVKNNDNNNNRFLFSTEDEMQYPLFICERKVIEENEEGFAIYYEYDYLAKVIQQQQMICGDLEFAFTSLSVQTIPEEIEEVEEPEFLPDEIVEEEEPMQPEVKENPEEE